MPLIADTDTVIRGRKRIGLLDQLGGGNLGDDATLQAVVQNIKSRWPDAERRDPREVRAPIIAIDVHSIVAAS